MNQDSYEKEQTIRGLADKLAEKTLREDYSLEFKRTVHLIKQHDLVGAMIANAMKQGEFDNLEGAGKPLNLEENPFEPFELRMAHKILKDNGYAPYWIELNKEINALQEKLDQEVEYFKKYTQIVWSEKRSGWAIKRYEQKKANFYTQSRERLDEISQKILDYNLHCPVSTLGRCNIDIELEISRIVEDVEKFIEEQKEV